MYTIATMKRMAALGLMLLLGALPAQAQRGAMLLDRLGAATAVEDAELDISTKSITVEAWIKHDGKSDEDAVIVGKIDGSYANYELSLVGSGEEVPVRFHMYYAGVGVESTVGIPANVWTHIAGVYNGSVITIYINGNPAGTKGWTGEPYDNDNPLSVGATAEGERYFSGQIDEIRIWKVIRGSVDIKNYMFQGLAGTEAGLVAYYPFTGATPLNDVAGTHADNLTVSGSAQVVAPGVFPIAPDLVARGGAASTSLKWTERLGPSNMNLASQFKIYRSTTADHSDRQLVTTLAAGTTTYNNTGLTNGNLYFYEITSLNASGQESDYSPVALGAPYVNLGGGSLKLDGTTFASVTHRPSLNLSDKAISVEAWIKHDGKSAGDAIIVSKISGSYSNYELALVGSGEEVPVVFHVYYDGIGVESTVGIPANKWTHVAGVYNGVQLAIYIDGVLAGTKGYSQDPYDHDKNLLIGAAADASRFFSGQIDEVRVWKKARSAAEVLADMDNTLNGDEDGLVAYYRFDEVGKTSMTGSEVTPSTGTLQAGANIVANGALPVGVQLFAIPTTTGADLIWVKRAAADLTGYKVFRSSDATGSDRELIADALPATPLAYSDNETVAGTTYYYEIIGLNSDGQQSGSSNVLPVTAEINLFGNALSVNGGGFVQVSHRPSLSIAEKAITVEAWVKPGSNNAAEAVIVSKRDGSYTNYELSLADGGDEFPVRFFTYYDGQAIESNVKVKANEWTHVAGTFNGVALNIYINGEPAGSRGYSTEPWDNDNPVGIGADIANSAGHFRGHIDEVRIWRRALPADEIKQYYNKVRTGNEFKLVGYFRMDEQPGTPIALASDMYVKSGVLEGDAVFIARATPIATEDGEPLPTEFELDGNYPNPFAARTTIRFALPKASDVRLVVYDLTGRQVAVLFDGQKPAGWHEVPFQAAGLPSGMYLYRLVAEGQSATGRMLLVK